MDELKIIIKAVTKDAVKPIQDVKKELNGLTKSGKSASSGIATAMKGVGIAAAAAVAAITAVIGALTALGKATVAFNKEQSKLVTAFQAVGASAQTANEAYRGFYRFLGDSGKAVEAAAHIAKIATSQESLAEWTKISQGIYATFGDSLPIEGLTEAANETLRVGKVTGTLADALNWAGVSEDDFNAKLATTTSFEEREALLRSTLNGLYEDASRIYEENNKELIAYNDSQARMSASMAAAGQACVPLLTAVNNLGTALFNALKPALDAIVPYIVTFVNWLAKGVETVMSFFSALTGRSAAIKTASEIGNVAGGLGSAADGAGNLAAGLEEAGAAAKEAKRHLQGFDELNVLKSDSSSGSEAPGYMSPTGGYFDNGAFSTEVEEGETKASDFVKKLKEKFAELKDIFAPTIDAWSNAFAKIKTAWDTAKGDFVNGANSIKDALSTLVTYMVGTFIPDIVNSFSTNFAPIFADVVSFAIIEAGKTFEWFGELCNNVMNDIVVPALDALKRAAENVFDAIGRAWQKHGKPFLDEASKAFQNLRNTVDNVYKTVIKPICEKIIQVFSKVWAEGVAPMVEKVVSGLLEIGRCLLQLYNETISPIVNWIINTILPIVVKVVNGLIDIAGELLIGITEVISAVVDVLTGVIQFITGVFTGDWDLAWTGIQNIFGGVWDAICAIVETAWNVIQIILSPVVKWFTNLWQGIKNVWNEVVQWFTSLFNNAWTGIQVAWSGVKFWFENLWNNIKSAWSSVTRWFTDLFSNAWSGIQTAWSGVKYWFESLWSNIKYAWQSASTWFTNLFSNAWHGVQNAWNGAISWFSNIWTSIKSIFTPVDTWFKSKFSAAWTNIKNVFSGWSSFFNELWNKIKNTFSGLGTSLGNAIGGGVKTAINSVIGWIESTINRAIGLINGAIDIINKLPGVSVGYVSTLSLPRLAEGGIANSTTIAMIGEAGKEAVLPLENNTEWMDRLADRIAARNSSPTQLILKVGERELGWATINGINQITKQTGELQLVL